MNTADQRFVTNLANTCHRHQLIREDGTELTLRDQWSGEKTNYEHFAVACKKLSELSVEHFNHISVEDQIEILARMKQIQKKIRKKDIRDECGRYLEQFEAKILTEDKVERAVDSIFKDFVRDAKADNQRKVNEDLGKIHMIIDHWKDDTRIFAQIAAVWRKGSNKVQLTPKSIALFDQANSTFVTQLLGKEETILRNKEVLDENEAENYPYLLRLELERLCKLGKKDELQQRIATLQTLMEKHHANEVFSRNCLQQLDQFLTNVVFNQASVLTSASKVGEWAAYLWRYFGWGGRKFTSVLSQSELVKTDLIIFEKIFPIINKALPSIRDDRELTLSLKLKCANLPTTENRRDYQELFLTERDQLEILISHFQRQEDDEVQSFYESLEKGHNPSHEGIYILAEMACGKSGLSNENVLKLREGIEKRLGNKAPQEWDNYPVVARALEEFFSFYSPGEDNLTKINYIQSTKKFFEDQEGFEESRILIPRWYHATNSFTKIMKGGQKIQIKHGKDYRGVWFSSQQEHYFGDEVIALSNKITDLDPEAFIGHQHFNARWRGVRKVVHLTSPEIATGTTLVAFPAERVADKIRVNRTVQFLQEKGFQNPVVFSTEQMDFMQNEILNVLGSPNLSEKWWGPGSLLSHQEQLHAEIRTLPVEPNLFTPEGGQSNQVKIARMVQTTALPLYKRPMPQRPSYRGSQPGQRVALSAKSPFEYRMHVEAVHNQKSTARDLHGTMHGARVALWTQLLAKVYERGGGLRVPNPILLATAGAYHDVAREDEGQDFWDEESSEALKTLLHDSISPEEAEMYIEAIKKKDPKRGEWVSDVQQILHDADCIEIVRVIGRWSFRKNELYFYQVATGDERIYYDKLIAEMIDFIEMTDKEHIRTYFEHHSEDFYGDLVRVLFTQKQGGKDRFPLMEELFGQDMNVFLEDQEKINKINQEIAKPKPASFFPF